MVPVSFTFKSLRSFSCSPCSFSWPSLTLTCSFNRSIISRSNDGSLVTTLLPDEPVSLTPGDGWLPVWLTFGNNSPPAFASFVPGWLTVGIGWLSGLVAGVTKWLSIWLTGVDGFNAVARMNERGLI